MGDPSRSITWATPLGELTAFVPSLDDVRPHVARLAAAYNEPANAQMVGHTELLDESDVLAHFSSLLELGGHPFLFLCDGVLVGDGDLRNINDGSAEFAFMICAPDAQGKGFGTRFALMVHAFAFHELALARAYASIIPANVASRRVFEKLGHVIDESPAALAYAEEEGDVVMSIERSVFTERHAAAILQLRMR